MEKLVIKRSEWARGKQINYSGDNGLWHNEFNSGCCLGHVVCKLFGVGKDGILEYGMPNEISFKECNFLVTEEGENTNFSSEAMEINDDEVMSEERREKNLIELFKTQNIELSFED